MDYATQLGALGYPGFAHLRSDAHVDAGELVVSMLAQSNLDVRLVEALPWVLANRHDLDWPRLLQRAVETGVQNRLGYLVQLALDAYECDHLCQSLSALERMRLDQEDTLCRDAMPDAERRWLRGSRSGVAKHWRMLSTLDRDQRQW